MLVGVVIVLFLMVMMAIDIIDKAYPKTQNPVLYRKYSPSFWAFMNSVTGFIRDSLGGTFGDGVYLGYAVDTAVEREIVARGGPIPVQCPPAASQTLGIAAAYEIPAPNVTPDPSAVTGYVEFAITRPSYYAPQVRTNGHGAQEVLITQGLIPFNGRKYLFIGNTEVPAFGIETAPLGWACW